MQPSPTSSLSPAGKPVLCIDRKDGAETHMALGEACERLARYFECSPGKVQQALNRGEVLRTVGFVYSLPSAEVAS